MSCRNFVGFQLSPDGNVQFSVWTFFLVGENCRHPERGIPERFKNVRVDEIDPLWERALQYGIPVFKGKTVWEKNYKKNLNLLKNNHEDHYNLNLLKNTLNYSPWWKKYFVFVSKWRFFKKKWFCYNYHLKSLVHGDLKPDTGLSNFARVGLR